MDLKILANGMESRENEVEGEFMTEDQFVKQRNMFARLVTFYDHLSIGPLNHEMSALEC